MSSEMPINKITWIFIASLCNEVRTVGQRERSKTSRSSSNKGNKIVAEHTEIIQMFHVEIIFLCNWVVLNVVISNIELRKYSLQSYVTIICKSSHRDKLHVL